MQLIESESALFALGMFTGVTVMLELGRRVGIRRRALSAEGSSPGMGAVEASTFALLGLMIAFTFQGAASRFDQRRALIVKEANCIGTAWTRIDLLSEDAQPGMRALFREYLDSRLEAYRVLPDMAACLAELEHGAELQAEIWSFALAGRGDDDQTVVVGMLPALNAMFDVVTERTMAARSHPPQVIFLMLVFLACAAAFMAGYDMSGNRSRSWMHSFGFAAILAITVLVIMDMEYPRRGMIRVDSFDEALADLRDGMN